MSTITTIAMATRTLKKNNNRSFNDTMISSPEL